jgi:hypothetical protein
MAEETHPTPDPGTDPAAAEGKQEAGAREQGVESEDSRDLSSPQLTEDAEPRTERAAQPRAGQGG